MLVMHVLKRSAGIGASPSTRVLDEQIAELAEAFMLLITATGFLEVSGRADAYFNEALQGG
jgi:nuclear pore complex protein Nup205